MLLIDIIITIIESYLLSWFIVKALNIDKGNKALITLSILFTLETEFFNDVYVNNVLLLLVEVITTMIILYYDKREFRFSYIITTSYGIGIILVSNIIALLVTTIVFDVSLYVVVDDVTRYTFIVILSKLICATIYMGTIKITKRMKSELDISRWWLLMVFMIIILGLIIIIGENIVYQTYSYVTLHIVLAGLIMLFVISMLIYRMINIENNKKLELTKEVIKNDYANRNYSRINYLYNRTIEDRHHMMYVLMNVQKLINSNQYQKANNILDKEIEEAKRFSVSFLSSNPYFDYRMQEKISTLKQQGYDVKTVYQIKHIQVLANDELVDDIIRSIDYLSKLINDNKRMSIFINQTDLYLVVKMNISSNKKRNLKFIKSSELIKKVEFIYDEKGIIMNILISII